MNDSKNQNQNFDFGELQKNLEKIDVLTKKLVFLIAKSKEYPFTQANQNLYSKAAKNFFEVLSNPSKLIETTTLVSLVFLFNSAFLISILCL